MTKERDEMREKIAKYQYSLIRPSKDWGEASKPVKGFFMLQADQILSLETDTCRIAVVRKEAKIPDPDPHVYEGEFDAICATKESAYKAGFVQEETEETLV